IRDPGGRRSFHVSRGAVFIRTRCCPCTASRRSVDDESAAVESVASVSAGGRTGSWALATRGQARSAANTRTPRRVIGSRSREEELAEEAHEDPGGSLDADGRLAIGVRGAGNVEVRPRISLHELAQEPSRSEEHTSELQS